MIVEILHVKYLFEEKLGLRFEVSHNLVVLSWCDQLLEFAEDVDATTRVVCIFHIFKVLNLHKEVQELVASPDTVNIDIQESVDFNKFASSADSFHGFSPWPDATAPNC